MREFILEGFKPVAVRFDPGDNVNQLLQDYLKKSGAGFIYVPGIVAQIDKAQFGFYKPQTGTYDLYDAPRPKDRYSMLEPIAISGNVAWAQVDNGETPFAHLHGAVASGLRRDRGQYIAGGHFTSIIIGRTGEAVLWLTDKIKMNRIMDPHPQCGVRIWQPVPKYAKDLASL